MFGRKWKYHYYDEAVPIDLDIAPHESGKAISALALDCIVNEMMESKDIMTTYHSDDSKKKRAVGYLVLGITMNSIYRPF